MVSTTSCVSMKTSLCCIISCMNLHKVRHDYQKSRSVTFVCKYLCNMNQNMVSLVLRIKRNKYQYKTNICYISIYIINKQECYIVPSFSLNARKPFYLLFFMTKLLSDNSCNCEVKIKCWLSVFNDGGHGDMCVWYVWISVLKIVIFDSSLRK